MKIQKIPIQMFVICGTQQVMEKYSRIKCYQKGPQGPWSHLDTPNGDIQRVNEPITCQDRCLVELLNASLPLW